MKKNAAANRLPESVLYLAPDGNDAWSGLLPKANKTKTDGPLRSLHGLQARLRLLRAGGNSRYSLSGKPPMPQHYTSSCLCGPLTVYMRGGMYPMESPLVLTPEDSWPMTIMAFKNERPVVSGGRRITGWKKTIVNGRAAWQVDIPEAAGDGWHFRQLFVNGRMAPRPRLPKKGLFRMREVPGMKLPAGWGNGGQTRFVCNAGEARPFRNLSDVDVVYLHFWIEERSPISAFDPETNTVTMLRPSVSALVGSHGSDLADYYLDNVFEALSEPGEWYLDRGAGRLYYLPMPGETSSNTEIYAPRCLQLVALKGEADAGRYVEHIRFHGVKFAHTDWRHPDASDGGEHIGPDAARTPHSRRHGRGLKASASQAACDVPGVIYLEGARFCAIEQCEIENVGWYGVEIADGCHGVRVAGNAFRNLGAGGVKINGAAARDPDVKTRKTGHHEITDNEIGAGGRIFHSAIGVLSMNAHNVAICHNHIHDFFYSGVSCGWEWGYQESVSRDNLIAYNHIHDIGQKLLSDMGGIYTLSVQPGTVIRNNLIHNISSAHYGGWCIYPDEGSSHILIENNVCYDADRQPFHQHYGRENIVRNNIWAFGGEAVAIYSRPEPHRGFTWTRNIMVGAGEPMFRSAHAPEVEAKRIHSDMNLYYSLKGRPYFEVQGKKISLKQWRAMGRDLRSLEADPKFQNMAKRDFRLKPGSPALKLGFEPIDLSQVGPRKGLAPGSR